MYYADFRLTGPPFENNLDQHFFFLSESHKEVLSALLYFVRERKGFALVCGDVGTGKTMLINTLLDRLPDGVQAITISNPEVGYREILSYIAQCIGVQGRQRGLLPLIDAVKGALQEADQQGTRYMLIIDEAHLLSDTSLEHIRLLSNIETDRHKLLQILLVGQYELSVKLSRPELRQLRQRININRALCPMDASETRRYIDHRLRTVGGSYDASFKPHCADMIHAMTGGVPRSINQLCDNAMLICKTAGLSKVDGKVLQRAEDALRSDILFVPDDLVNNLERKPVKLRLRLSRGLLWAAPYLLVLVAIAVAGHAGLVGKQLEHTTSAGLPDKVSESDASRRASPPPALKRKIPMPQTLPGQNASPPPAGVSNPEASSIPPTLESQLPSTPGGEDAGNTTNASVPAPISSSGSPRSAPANAQEANTASGIKPPAADSAPESTTAAPAERMKPEVEARLPYRMVLEPAHSAPLRPKRIQVKKGDTILNIARQWYPEDPQTAYQMILKANPGIRSGDTILPGQFIELPETNGQAGSSQPEEKLHYAPYGDFDSRKSAEKAAKQLSGQGVHCAIVEAIEAPGKTNYHLLIGGYESAADLEQAVKQAQAAQYCVSSPDEKRD